jgi:anti-anti-sigma factor
VTAATHAELDDDCVVVALDDEFLLEGLAQLRSGVTTHLMEGNEHLVVDIAGVSRLSSATVAALLWTKRHCRSRGSHVVVRGPSQDSVDMLTRAGLSGVFDIQLASEVAEP